MKKNVILVMLLSIFILSGCERDTSSPSKALIGHWEDDNYDIYFSANKTYSFIKEDAEPEEKRSYNERDSEEKEGLEYTVLAEDKEEKRITIRYKDPYKKDAPAALALRIRFNSDYTEAYTSIDKKHTKFAKGNENIFSQDELDKESTTMEYVDDKKRPN